LTRATRLSTVSGTVKLTPNKPTRALSIAPATSAKVTRLFAGAATLTRTAPLGSTTGSATTTAGAGEPLHETLCPAWRNAASHAMA